MGRVMYTYDNRYMLMATVRADASSRLAKGHQWHTYPAVSAGWNIRQEEFMDEVDWIDILKLRVGYGQTSNQAVDPYKTWDAWQPVLITSVLLAMSPNLLCIRTA